MKFKHLFIIPILLLASCSELDPSLTSSLSSSSESSSEDSSIIISSSEEHSSSSEIISSSEDSPSEEDASSSELFSSEEIESSSSEHHHKSESSSSLITRTITYVIEDGINNEENPSTYTKEDIVFIKNPIYTGEKDVLFGGWYTTSNYDTETELYQIYKEDKGDITLYAKWEYIDLSSKSYRVQPIYESYSYEATLVDTNSTTYEGFKYEYYVDSFTFYQGTEFNVCDEQNHIASLKEENDLIALVNNHYMSLKYIENVSISIYSNGREFVFVMNNQDSEKKNPYENDLIYMVVDGETYPIVSSTDKKEGIIVINKYSNIPCYKGDKVSIYRKTAVSELYDEVIMPFYLEADIENESYPNYDERPDDNTHEYVTISKPGECSCYVSIHDDGSLSLWIGIDKEYKDIPETTSYYFNCELETYFLTEVTDYDGSDYYGGEKKYVSEPFKVESSSYLNVHRPNGAPIYASNIVNNNVIQINNSSNYLVHTTTENAILTVYVTGNQYSFILTGYSGETPSNVPDNVIVEPNYNGDWKVITSIEDYKVEDLILEEGTIFVIHLTGNQYYNYHDLIMNEEVSTYFLHMTVEEEIHVIKKGKFNFTITDEGVVVTGEEVIE